MMKRRTSLLALSALMALLMTALVLLMLRLLAHVLLQDPGRAAQLPPDQVLARLDRHYGATAGLSAGARRPPARRRLPTAATATS